MAAVPMQEIYATLGLSDKGDLQSEDYVVSDEIGNEHYKEGDWRRNVTKQLRDYLKLKALQMCFLALSPTSREDHEEYRYSVKHCKNMEWNAFHKAESKDNYLCKVMMSIENTRNKEDNVYLKKIKSHFEITKDDFQVQENVFTPDDIGTCARELHSCLSKKQGKKIDKILQTLEITKINEVLDRKIKGCPAIFKACHLKNQALVQRFLQVPGIELEQNGVYLEQTSHAITKQRQKKYYTMRPLWLSLLQHDTDLVKILVEKGADVNTPSPKGCSPIEYACCRRDTDLLHLLISQGGNIHRQNDSGRTYLMQFINQPEVVKVLLEHIDVNVKDKEGYTAIHYATENVAIETMKKLITKGSDVNSTSTTGLTPVYLACRAGHIGLLKYLHRNGGDIHSRFDNGKTLLMLFVQNADICRYLIKHSIDLDATDNTGRKAIHHCFESPCFESLKLLLHNGEKIDLDDEQGIPLYLYPAIKGDEKCAKYILDNIEVPAKFQINSYELLAASEMLNVRNLDTAVSFWNTSLEFRKRYNRHDKTVSLLNDKFSSFTEPVEADDIQDNDEEECYTVHIAALIQARILGPYHPALLSTLSVDRLMPMEAAQFYEGCFDAFHHLLDLKMRHDRSHDHKSWGSACFYIHWLLYFPYKMDVDMIKNVINCLLKHLVDGVEEVGLGKSGNLRFLLEAVSRLFYYMFRSQDTVESRTDNSVKEMLVAFIQKAPRPFCNNFMLLDLLQWINESFYTRNWYEELCTSAIYDFTLTLVENGVHINQVVGNTTPLIYLLEVEHIDDKEKLDEIIRLMYERGNNHIDMKTGSGKTLGTLLQERGISVCIANDQTLQCLAANVICLTGIPFKNKVPLNLYAFINLHK